MTLVTVRRRPVAKSFNNFIYGFFAPLPSIESNRFVTANFKQFPAVNVKEEENGYGLEVVAPGWEKEDFKIRLDKNLLTIGAEKKEVTENKNDKLIKKEYVQSSFERSFWLDKTIDAEKIDAKYENGVLTLNLPKRAEVKEPKKEITVA